MDDKTKEIMRTLCAVAILAKITPKQLLEMSLDTKRVAEFQDEMIGLAMERLMGMISKKKKK